MIELEKKGFFTFTLLPGRGNEDELLIVCGLRMNGTLGFILHRRLLTSLAVSIVQVIPVTLLAKIL
jgi:hypothetical protein